VIVVLPRPLQKLVDVVLLLVDNGLYDIFLFSGRCATYLADKFRGYKNFLRSPTVFGFSFCLTLFNGVTHPSVCSRDTPRALCDEPNAAFSCRMNHPYFGANIGIASASEITSYQ
jgi:hypothetical protein